LCILIQIIAAIIRTTFCKTPSWQLSLIHFQAAATWRLRA
jgi:hypothetical protein